jgi:hypothetical protein
MEALPRSLNAEGHPDLTGVSCPECCGMLTVRQEGRNGALVFACRIGHTFALGELLAAKEERLDEELWGAVTRLEELIALLVDLKARSPADAQDSMLSRYRRRRRDAEALARQLRQVIEHNRPIDLSETPTAGDVDTGEEPGDPAALRDAAP